MAPDRCRRPPLRQHKPAYIRLRADPSAPRLVAARLSAHACRRSAACVSTRAIDRWPAGPPV